MITATTFIDFTAHEIATSKCFQAEADDDRIWVIRGLWNARLSKRLCNQYISGILAQEYGLNTPEVSLIDLDMVLSALRDRGLAVTSRVGVGARYLDGISNVLPPDPYEPAASDFPRVNREHLLSVFGERYDFYQFYAYRIFSRWLQLEDDHKWANLYLLPNLVPVFIDFDLALGGTSWESLPNGYDWGSMHYQAPFCEGVCTDKERFEPWFQRLLDLDETEITKRIRMIPDEWGIPSRCIDYVCQLLLAGRESLVDEFRYYLEVQSYLEIPSKETG